MAAATFLRPFSLNSPHPDPPVMSQDTIPRRENPVLSPFRRNAQQFGLFMAGAGFLAASVAITRRSVIRKKVAMIPPFYVSNRNPISSSDKEMLAVQALGLATLNVMSFAVMLVGGISWGFNISTLDELGTRAKVALQRPTGLNPELEKESEVEVEKMMDSLMERMGMKKPEIELKIEPSGKDSENQ